jgi:hypothetical protein
MQRREALREPALKMAELCAEENPGREEIVRRTKRRQALRSVAQGELRRGVESLQAPGSRENGREFPQTLTLTPQQQQQQQQRQKKKKKKTKKKERRRKSRSPTWQRRV